jgi:hypothetical protein
MWLIKLNSLTNFLAFFIGIIFYTRFPKEIKTVFYFVAFGAFTETFMRFYQLYITKNTMPVGHFYFPIAFVILGIFYMQVLKNFVKPIFILLLIIAFVTYSIINTLFIQNLYEYANIVSSIGALIIFLLSVTFFTKVMVEAKITKLSQEPLIWINIAILIYYTGNFFHHSLYNLRLNASIDVAILAAKLFSVLNILFYLIIAIGFLKVKKQILQK